MTPAIVEAQGHLASATVSLSKAKHALRNRREYDYVDAAQDLARRAAEFLIDGARSVSASVESDLIPDRPPVMKARKMSGLG